MKHYGNTARLAVALMGTLALTATPLGTALAGYDGPEAPAPDTAPSSSKLTSKTDRQLEAQKAKPVYVHTSKLIGIWIPAGLHKPGSHPQFFGKVRDGNGRWVYCTMPYLPFSTGKIVMTKKALKAQRKGESVIVKTAINKYFSSANKPVSAAALGLVAYSHTTDVRFQHDLRYYRHALGKTVTRKADSENSWAAKHAGPYHAFAIKWSKDQVAPGETNVGRLTLKSSNGKPVKGYTPEVSCPSNTTVESVSRTNSHGVAKVTVHSKDDNAGHGCRYTIGHLPDPKRSLTASPSGSQQLTTGPVYTKVGNKGKFGNEHIKGSFTNNCGTSCGPDVPIKGVVKVPCGGYNGHAVATDLKTGKVVEDVTVKACTKKTVKFVVPNGDLHTLQWTLTFVHHGVETTPRYGSKFKINCPPSPTVKQSSSTNCTGCSSFDLTGMKPSSSRAYSYAVELNGSKPQSGDWKTLSASTPISINHPHGGDTVDLWIKAGGVKWEFSYMIPKVSKTS